MAATTRIDDELNREISAIAKSVACELLQLEFKGGVLRIVLDRADEAVTVDHCATVSRQVSALLDVMDFGPARYVLEVTSPGLDRPLTRPEDYERFTGRLAKITFEDPDHDVRTTVTGRIERYLPGGGGTVHLLDEQERPLEIPFGRISRARLEVEL
jgi:ribosome maturation factor RimP